MNATDPSFFFIPNLTEEPTGAELVVLLVLYVGSQLGSTLVSLSTATDQMQRRLMLALPFIFVPFIINFPAGLILYWITTNFWTLGQSFVVKWMRIRQGDPVLVGSSERRRRCGGNFRRRGGCREEADQGAAATAADRRRSVPDGGAERGETYD